jgi:hypothetical protein
MQRLNNNQYAPDYLPVQNHYKTQKLPIHYLYIKSKYCLDNCKSTVYKLFVTKV